MRPITLEVERRLHVQHRRLQLFVPLVQNLLLAGDVVLPVLDHLVLGFDEGVFAFDYLVLCFDELVTALELDLPVMKQRLFGGELHCKLLGPGKRVVVFLLLFQSLEVFVL